MRFLHDKIMDTDLYVHAETFTGIRHDYTKNSSVLSAQVPICCVNVSHRNLLFCHGELLLQCLGEIYCLKRQNTSLYQNENYVTEQFPKQFQKKMIVEDVIMWEKRTSLPVKLNLTIEPRFKN